MTEETPPENSMDIIKASDIARDYIMNNFMPWVFMFQIDSIKPNTHEGIYFVQCSFMPGQGGYTRHYYDLKINIKTGHIDGLKAFSLNIKTGDKKSLEVSPPK